MNEPAGMFPGAGNDDDGAYEATGFPQSTGAPRAAVVVVGDCRRADVDDRSSREHETVRQEHGDRERDAARPDDSSVLPQPLVDPAPGHGRGGDAGRQQQPGQRGQRAAGPSRGRRRGRSASSSSARADTLLEPGERAVGRAGPGRGGDRPVPVPAVVEPAHVGVRGEVPVEGACRRREAAARDALEVGGHRAVAAADTDLNRSSYGWPEPRLMSVSASALLASNPSMRAVASATVRR